MIRRRKDIPSLDQMLGNGVPTPAQDSRGTGSLPRLASDIAGALAGQIRNAANTAGIVFDGVLPAAWTRYLNLLGTGIFLKHDKLQLDYAGTATFSGTLRSQVGQSTLTAPAVQMLYTNANVASGVGVDHSVVSFSLPANALATNGDSLRITVIGHGGGNGDGISVKFGSTAVVNRSLLGSTIFRYEAKVTRTGAATQVASDFYIELQTTTQVNVVTTSPAETLSGAITIDFRVANAVAITFDTITIEYLGT